MRAVDENRAALGISQKKRVVLVIAHLGPGGAQRVVATAANALIELGLDVHVVQVLGEPADAYIVDLKVSRHWLASSSGRKRRSVFVEKYLEPIKRSVMKFDFVKRPVFAVAFSIEFRRRAKKLRRILMAIDPDAVLSFLTQTNILTLLATRGLPVRVVISERNDPTRQYQNLSVNLLRNLLYRQSDVVTANSAGAVETLASIVPRQKLALLPNPLCISDWDASVTFSAPTFVTVTRFVAQKGIDILLKAAALAFAKLPDWRLAIIGEGPLREELRTLADDLGIASRIDWIGFVKDPISYLRAAKFFVLTSRFEGSPNALLEAMACGLPSVVTDASPGPLELIGDEAGVIVRVEDVDATASAIVLLATDEMLRARLGAAAARRTDMYRLENAMRVWLNLLDVA